MKISDFTDARIAEIRRGQPMTVEERAFLIEDTATFEECGKLMSELAEMTDAELMAFAYGVWADYSICL